MTEVSRMDAEAIAAGQFLPDDEQRLFDSIVHSCRSRGLSRMDAEDLALERIEQRRAILLRDQGEE